MLQQICLWACVLWASDDSFRLEGHGNAIEAVAVCSKEGWIASGDWDGKLRIWDIAAKKSLHAIDAHPGKMINDLDAAPAAGVVATAGDDGHVRLWDVTTGKKIQELLVGEFIIKCVAVSPDGKQVATRYGEWDDEVQLWDVATGKPSTGWKGLEDSVSTLDFDGKGERLAVGTYDGRVRVFALGKEEALMTFALGEMNPYDAEFSPDGKMLAVAAGDHSVRVFDLASQKEIARLSPIAAGEDDGNGMVDVAWSPDGKTVVCASTDNFSSVWSLEKKALVARFEGHHEYTNGVTFSADGSQVISGGDDNALRVSPMPAATKKKGSARGRQR